METDNRTFAQFTKAKLGMGAKEFCALVGKPRETLYWQWNNPKTRHKVKDLIEEVYFTRYNQL